MTREFGKKRRPSTVNRDNMVHRVYKKVREEIGVYADYVSKSTIYNMLRERTGLCTRTIAAILNHTVSED